MNKYEFNIYEQIARNIKKYRIKAGITQAELAEMVGVSHEFIRRNESKKGKKSFSVDTLWKISKKFHSKIDDIARVNEIDDISKIYPGQQLYIPKFCRKSVSA